MSSGQRRHSLCATKPGTRRGHPRDHHSSGALAFHPFLTAADAHSQPCIPPCIHPTPAGSSPCSRGCQALSRIITPRPGRGNPVLSPAAPGPRFRTLPSILRPGFRSLSAPNNAALAEHLPRAAPAPADGLAGASCHCPERLRARGQKAAAELSRGVPALPTMPDKTSGSEGRRGAGRHTGHDGVKKGCGMSPSGTLPAGKITGNLDGWDGPAADAAGCRHCQRLTAWWGNSTWESVSCSKNLGGFIELFKGTDQ